MKRLKVMGTANFARNLEALRDFHTEHPEAFVKAVARLQDGSCTWQARSCSR